MKNILIALVLVSGLVFGQQASVFGKPAGVLFLKGTPALGATYTNSTFDSSRALYLGGAARLALRVQTGDSTYAYVSLWKKEASPLSQTWVAVDSILIHPASGAAADTVWTLRSHATDIPKGTGTQYQFQYRFQSTGNWATQATAASLKVWLEYVAY